MALSFLENRRGAQGEMASRKEEKEVLLTAEGLKKLEEELNYLKTVKRREVAERIKQAVGFGDLSENAEYEHAKNEQAFTEGRIIALEKKLAQARIIGEEEISTETVTLGSKVLLRDLDRGEERKYELVSSLECNPVENKISDESPVGRALLGQKVGTAVEINVPAGRLHYQILEIKR